MAAGDETRFREFAYSLVQRFSRLGVSIMMTFEVQDLFEAPRLSDSAVSHLSDNIVLLSYVKEQDSINRVMSVVKSRASHHEPGIRQFLIGRDGIVLADGRQASNVPDIDPQNPASRPATHRDP